MLAKIVRMLRPVRLSAEDLEITELACRHNAARCRRKGAIEEAARWQRVADRIRARALRCPSEG